MAKKRVHASWRKPTAYLDTSVISAFWYRGHDLIANARRRTTRDWWDSEGHQFRLLSSNITQLELSAGTYRYQERCLQMVQRLPYLPMTRAVREIADELVDGGLIPESKLADALQMAFAVAGRTDYLLSWNYAHLVNTAAQEKLDDFCASRGFRVPLLVSP